MGYRQRWAAVPLVLVARGTAAGVRVALERVGEAAEAKVAVAVLVVVADGPWPAPRAVRRRLRLLDGHVGAVVLVPYVTAWRYVDDPLEVEPIPRNVAGAVAAIEAALDECRSREW